MENFNLNHLHTGEARLKRSTLTLRDTHRHHQGLVRVRGRGLPSLRVANPLQGVIRVQNIGGLREKVVSKPPTGHPLAKWLTNFLPGLPVEGSLVMDLLFLVGGGVSVWVCYFKRNSLCSST